MAREISGTMLHPRHPERICWGCDQYCPAEKLGCANGSIRTPHPSELFGDDWLEWEQHGAGPESTPEPTRPSPVRPQSGS